MGPELVGEDFFGCTSETGCSKDHKAGRPPEIAAETLRRNVIEIQFALEQSWGEVGWLLKQAKTEADVRAAFAKTVNPRCHLLEPFTTDHICTTTALRQLRKKAMTSKERHRRLFADMKRAREICERGLDAWVADSDSVKRAHILDRTCQIRPRL